MKKEIIITLSMLVLIIVLNCITQNYTKKSVNLLNNKLEDIKQEIIKQELNEDIVKIKMNELENLWKQRKNILAYYIEHDELEKVESKISLIKGNIETSSYEETVPDIEDTAFILRHIEEKYKFIIKNVF